MSTSLWGAIILVLVIACAWAEGGLPSPLQLAMEFSVTIVVCVVVCGIAAAILAIL